MKTAMKRSLTVFFGLALALVAGSASAVTCYNNYCPNTSSPVVGGFVTTPVTCQLVSDSSVRCTKGDGNYVDVRIGADFPPPRQVTQSGGFHQTFTYYDFNVGAVFGNVNVPDGQYGDAFVQPHCPANTAKIEVPNGYTADNGITYGPSLSVWSYHLPAAHASTSTFVCVRTDTNKAQ